MLASGEAAPTGALDLHGGISTPTASGCERARKNARLKSSSGEFKPVRCKATNLCRYCAKLTAVENAEMLWLDALNGSAPSLWVILTTRSANPDPAAFYDSRRKLLLALKRRWPDAEVATLLEFSTGYGPRSGGIRRPHWNLLLKGVPAGAAGRVREVVDRVWCGRVDAEPQGQKVVPLHDAGGLVKYLALHFQKESQAPPAGWRGHRFMTSRGYFGAASAAAVRAEARTSLRAKRDVWKARQRLGSDGSVPDPQLVELEAAVIRAERESESWELVHTRQFPGSLVFAPGAAVDRAPPAADLAPRWRAWLTVGRPYALDLPASSPVASGSGRMATDPRRRTADGLPAANGARP